jgi:hypothetical protein
MYIEPTYIERLVARLLGSVVLALEANRAAGTGYTDKSSRASLGSFRRACLKSFRDIGFQETQNKNKHKSMDNCGDNTCLAGEEDTL